MENPGHPSDGAGLTSGSSRLPPPDEHDAWADLGPFYIMEDAPPPSELKYLGLLESFFLPLTPEEMAERTQMNREGGFLTRDMIVRALGGDPG